jgi:site-specific DNA-methyltransferase (adenine-specific)
MCVTERHPDNYFDLAIIDPPYGIGASKPSLKNSSVTQKNGSKIRIEQKAYAHKDWDYKIPSPEEIAEIKRVSKQQIIWGVNYFCSESLRGGRIIWDKLNNETDQFDCEVAYYSGNNRTDLVYCMWNGMMQGTYCGRDIRKALVQQGNKQLNERRIHPTQKPVLLYKWLLINYGNKGGG